MSRVSPVRLVAVLTLFSAINIGCASFGGGLLPKVKEFPTRSDATKPSVKLTLQFKQFMNDAPLTVFRGSVENDWKKKLAKTLSESGYFASVAEDTANPDITIDANVKDDGHGSMGMAIVTGLTLYLVPSFSTDSFVFDAKVTSPHVDKTWAIHLEDFVTQWQQLFLIPVMPFKMAPVVASGVQKNLLRNVVVEFDKQGILDAVASAPDAPDTTPSGASPAP